MFTRAGDHQEISDWFPVRIESVESDGYLFVEWEIDPDGDGRVKDGGRSNTDDDLAHAIDGSAFAAEDICLARRAPGMGGVGWELAPLGVGGGGAGLWCAEPGTLGQRSGPAIWENEWGSEYYSLPHSGPFQIWASDGYESTAYQTGGIAILPLHFEAATGRWRNAFCIPADSGEWAISWGARVALIGTATAATGFFRITAFAHLIVIDEDGHPTTATDGDGRVVASWTAAPVPVVAGQMMFRPGGVGDDTDLIVLGDAASYINGDSMTWDKATGAHTFRLKAGAETIRLAIRYFVRWSYGDVPPDPGISDYPVADFYVGGMGTGETFIAGHSVGTAVCVGCGSGSGSGSGGGCCEIEGGIAATIPADVPGAGGATSAAFEQLSPNSWRWNAGGGGGFKIWLLTCTDGAYTLADHLGNSAANTEEVDCEAFALAFDAAEFGGTGEITMVLA